MHNDMKRLRSHYRWNKIVSFCESVSQDVQHGSALTVGSLSERDLYYMKDTICTLQCLEMIKARTKVLRVSSFMYLRIHPIFIILL